MKYIAGLIMIAVGVLFVWKSQWFINFFGRIAWAEAKLGSTWTFYKLAGVLLILIAFMYMATV